MKKNERIPALVNDRRCTNWMKVFSGLFRSPSYGFKGVIILFGLLVCQAHGQGSSQAFLTNGLVAYYPFNGNANDMSGNGDNGQVVGALLTADRFGTANSAYAFTRNILSKIITTGEHLPTGSSPRTISFWFMCTNAPLTTDFFNPLISYGAANVTGGLVLIGYDAQGLFDLVGGGGMDFKVGGKANYDTKWHHCIIIIPNQTTMYGYFDDKQMLIGYSVPPGVWQTRPSELTIGYSPATLTGFDGAIDQVRFYNRVLSPSEVHALYQYESYPQKRITIAKAVRLDLTVEVGKRYQLESSNDLSTWTPYGTPFTAASEAFSQYIDVAAYDQYFRLVDAP